MSQHDYTIDNQSFPAFRTDLNNVLGAINSTNSGSSRPSSAVAGTIWLDTSGAATAQLLKMYDGAADILLGTVNFTANTIDWSDSAITLGANSVDSDNYVDGSIDLAHLAADSVDATKIADNAISEEHLDVTSITGHTAETSIADGDTILIHDASASALRKMTKANFVSGIGGTNTPAFEAYLSSAQSVSDATLTKAQPNTELFDTDSAYDNSSTYRFTPQVAGKYLIWGVIAGYSDAASQVDIVKTLIYKNGSVARNVTMDMRSNPGRYIMPHVQTIQEANGSTDYFEFYGYVNGTTGSQTFQASTSNLDGTRWGAYKLIT